MVQESVSATYATNLKNNLLDDKKNNDEKCLLYIKVWQEGNNDKPLFY